MKNLLAKRLYIGVCWSAGLVVAWSLFFALLVFWVQPFPTSQVLGFLVFFLNFLPIVICMIVLFFATNNTVFSIAATGFAVTILSIVNRFKIALRQDPLTSWDFVLGAEVFNSLRTSDPSLGFLLFFVLVFGVVLIGGLAWFIRNKKMPTILRLPGLVLSLALAVLVTNTTMSSINLFQSIEVIGTRHRMEDYFNSRGFLYAFIHTHLRWEISQPEGFNAAQVREQIDALPAPEGSHPAQLPHIFMILSEAFTDLSESPYFHFHEGHEPLYNFINMANEGHWGHIVVPNYGGGTADTEFDILTGINSRQFRATAYSNRLITRPFAGLTQILNDAGYHSQALHPGWPWFYNRANTFEFLGFDNFKTFYDFDPPPEWLGGYPSDKSVTDALIRRLDEHMQTRPNTPLFEFVVTVQNHWVSEHKFYSAPMGVLESDHNLTYSEMRIMSNYFYGLRHSDNQLRRFANHLNTIDEPVIIVFFGDHMPAISPEIVESHRPTRPNLGRDPLPSLCPEMWDIIRDFTVPFIIWGNDAFTAPDLPAGQLMSSYHLGAYVLEYIGLGNTDSFYSFLNDLRRRYPIQKEWGFFDTAGDRWFHNEGANEMVEFHRHWSYYRLFQ